MPMNNATMENSGAAATECLKWKLVDLNKNLQLPICEEDAEKSRQVYRDLYCKHLISKQTFDEKMGDLNSRSLDEDMMVKYKAAVARL
jgi:hypothetical protein